MSKTIETFADVLHHLVDGEPLTDEEKAQAHTVLDTASGQRTPPTEPDPEAIAAARKLVADADAADQAAAADESGAGGAESDEAAAPGE